MSSENINIIIPVYNRPELIKRCLDSVYAQNEPVRVAVVDNASTDDTVAHIERWRDAHRREGFELTLLSERIKGAAAARQTGFDSLCPADDDIVMFFDSDDTMRPGLLRIVREIFSATPQTDMVTWLECVHQLDGKEKISKKMKGEDPMEMHLIHSVLSTQRYAVRAGLFARAGGWRPEIMVWNDWETGVRLLQQQPRIHAIDRPLVDVYCQTESITGTSFSSRADDLKKTLHEVALDLVSGPVPRRDRWRVMLLWRYMILAAHFAREGRSDLAKKIMKEFISFHSLDNFNCYVFKAAYHYTRLGGRGAYSLVRRLIIKDEPGERWDY